MGRRHLVLLIALVGCDKIFDLREVTAPDAAIDAPEPDTPDAYMPVLGCSPMSMISEEFDVSPPKWFPVIGGDNPATISGGAAHINMTMTGYSTVSTGYFYDLRDDQVTIEVTDAGVGTDYYAVAVMASIPGSELLFERSGADLVMRQYGSPGPSELGRVTYSATQHRFLRFANMNGQTTFLTSPDGVTFTPRATLADPTWLGMMHVEVFAARSSTTTTAYQVTLYSVHGGTSTVGACPARELRDDFEGTALAEQWGRSTAYGNGTLTEQNGAAEFTYAADGTSYANITLTPLAVHDLRGDAFAVEIPQMVNTSTSQYFTMVVTTIDRKVATFTQQMGQLRASKNNATGVFSATYSATQHRWWRIRENAGTVYWEVSADGVTYNPFGEATDLTGLEAVDIWINASGTAATPVTARVTNFNTP